jgi:hypothetical protein
MNEQITLILLIAGGVVMVIGWLWLIFRCFKPFLAFLKQAFAPFALICIGVCLALFGPVYNKIYPAKPDAKPVETEKKDEKGNTEQGETIGRRKDIDKLKADKTAERLQLNNPKLELTDDEVKEILEGRDNLTYLDVSNQPVTDATLERLVKMPNLKKLYASKTKFTTDAVVKLVLTNPDCKLTEIDFSNLTPPVPGKALREWKEKDKDNRKFNN